MLSKLRRSLIGSMVQGVIALVVGLATVIISVMVVLMLTSSLNTTATSLLGDNSTYGSNATSTAINTTRSALFSNTFQAINLLTILPIILVAGVIIAAVGGFLMWYRK